MPQEESCMFNVKMLRSFLSRLPDGPRLSQMHALAAPEPAELWTLSMCRSSRANNSISTAWAPGAASVAGAGLHRVQEELRPFLNPIIVQRHPRRVVHHRLHRRGHVATKPARTTQEVRFLTGILDDF